MNRLLLFAATLVAGALVAAPTVIGLSGNTSFSRDIQVPVPSGAHQVRLGEASIPAEHPSAAARSTAGRRGAADDHPEATVAPSTGTDDHGGLRTGVVSGPDGGSTGPDGATTGSDDRSGRDDPASDHSGGGRGGRG